MNCPVGGSSYGHWRETDFDLSDGASDFDLDVKLLIKNPPNCLELHGWTVVVRVRPISPA